MFDNLHNAEATKLLRLIVCTLPELTGAIQNVVCITDDSKYMTNESSAWYS